MASAILGTGNEDGRRALAWMIKSLRSNPSNSVAATRLVSVLSQRDWPLPRSLAILARVNGVEFSPDGRKVVTASDDKNVTVWETRTGARLCEFSHTNAVQWAKFSPDGRSLATAEGTSARIWNLETKQLQGALTHAGKVTTLDFSPDGNQLLTGDSKGKARVWNWKSNTIVTLSHAHALGLVKYSPGGESIFISDGGGHLWSATSGQRLWASEGKVGAVAVFHPSGAAIAVIKNGVTLLDTKTGKELTPGFAGSTSPVGLGFSSTGDKLAVAEDYGQTLDVFDVRKQSGGRWSVTNAFKNHRLVHRAGVHSVDWSPDDQRMVSSSADKTVRVWSVKTGELVAAPLYHNAKVRSVRFSPDGNWLVTLDSAGEACLWDLRPSTAVAPALIHPAGVGIANAIALSPDQSTVGTGDQGGMAAFWELSTGRLIQRMQGPKGHARTVSFSPDGKQMLASTDGGLVTVWSVPDGKVVRTLDSGKKGNCYWAEFSPDGKWIAVAHEYSLALWDASSGALVKLAPASYPWRLYFSPDSRWITTPNWSGILPLWSTDAHLGSIPIMKLEAKGAFETSFEGADFDRKSERLAGGGRNNEFHIVKVPSGEILAGPMKHNGWVHSLSFDPSGRLILSGSFDGTARLWDSVQGTPVSEPLRHDGRVYVAKFSADGRWFATGSQGRVRVWDTATAEPLTEWFEHKARVNMIQFTADGRQLAAAGSERVARLWPLPPRIDHAPPWFIELAETVIGVRINDDGVSEPTLHSPYSHLERLGKLDAKEQATDLTRWARWFLSDREERTLSWSSKVPNTDYLRRLLEDGTKEALAEAGELYPYQPLVMATQSRAKPNTAAGKALAKLAAQLAPDDPEVNKILNGE